MAATITDIGSGTSIAAPTSITTGATITATTSNNDWLVVLVVWAKGADASTGCSDSAGNTYTERVNAGFVGSTSGVRLAIYTAPVTSNITNGTITATYSTTSPQCAIQVYRVRPSSGTVSFVAADTVGVGAENTSHTAATISVTNGNTIFGCAGVETDDPITGDTDTTNGNWSADAVLLADSGTDVNAQTLISQYKTVTATGNQSWNCSTVAARPGLASYLVLKAQTAVFSLAAALGQYSLSGPAVTLNKGKTLAAAASSYALSGTSPVTPELGRVAVAGPGSYSLGGTVAATTHQWKLDATVAGSYSLTGTDATPFKTAVAGKTITAELGTYALAGSDAMPLHGWMVTALAGSYTMAGSDAATTHVWRATVDDVGSYVLTGNAVGLNAATGNKTAIADLGSYSLTGTAATLTQTVFKTLTADSGSYNFLGTNASLLHGWRIAAGSETTGGDLLLETGDDLLLETGDSVLLEEGSVITGGVYALTGSDVALATAANKVILATAGSYLLTGTDVALTTGLAPPSVSPLHIGEWPVDKRRRRRREDAAAAEQRARKRFRDAIGRLLEGLPPEFDEPADLDEALDNAVQAANLLYALSAPIREINAVNELINHIRQLRIAQPIAQLHLAQAYNQAHRHLMAKAQEDTVMALLLGE